MVTSLCNALAVMVLLQAPDSPPPGDSLAALRGRAARDSTDAQLWLLMGRAYFELGSEAHGATHRGPEDSVWTRAVLDTAEDALQRAAALAGPAGSTTLADSARMLRVGTWMARSWLAWETAGIEAGQVALGPLPTDLRVPAVLEELGENLLRACPNAGALFTADAADSYGAWYMRFVRNLRPDLIVIPLAVWRSDRVLRRRLAADLKLGRRTGDDMLPDLARHRPVCVSMAFERPPSHMGWDARPLEWVSGGGPANKSPRVPPRDFVFAALRLALDQHDPWADPALATYTRAARITRALCEPLATFKVAAEVPVCKR
ncbi:MAG TPA: hypothetical protein VM716_12645 [Gemmatimonadales bacterium]|nr:hypothetical protein [Gemmatimonadales bacterium]